MFIYSLSCSPKALFYLKHKYTLSIGVVKVKHKIFPRASSVNQWLCIKDITITSWKVENFIKLYFGTTRWKVSTQLVSFWVFFPEIWLIHLTLCSVNILEIYTPLSPLIHPHSITHWWVRARSVNLKSTSVKGTLYSCLSPESCWAFLLCWTSLYP